MAVGSFLIEAYSYLLDLFIELYTNTKDKNYKDYFIEKSPNITLNLKGRKEILSRCIHGVDIDSEAFEVTKMSLCLKVIDSIESLESYNEIGFFGKKILEDIGNNIKCGNSLISYNFVDTFRELDSSIITNEVKPFDWNKEFRVIYEKKGGFDYVIGNPPYVEVKNYKTNIPEIVQYIKNNYSYAQEGKVDLAIPFIEKGLKLLNEGGKFGILYKTFFQCRLWQINYKIYK